MRKKRRRNRRRPVGKAFKKRALGLLIALVGGWLVIYMVPLWAWYVVLGLLAVALIGLLTLT